MEVFKKVHQKKENNQWSGSRAEEVADDGGTPETTEQQMKILHCPLKASWHRTCSRSGCQQWMTGRGTEYSVLAPSPTTRLLDHPKRPSRLLPRPRHDSRSAPT
ncbi:UNVERIFIED_CONTAM: hypothetical protein Sindi_2030400 [Sesamum indicum]